MTVPIGEQVACIERELRQRARVYPRLIESGRMTKQKADEETRRMEAVLATLQKVAEGERLI